MRIVSRQEWGARPPKKVTPFRWPAAELYVHHLATEGWHGPAGMRACQRFHQDTRGWRDIAYTFLVDQDGTIYEGTGPHVVGTHTKGRNSRAMAICAMGNYEARQPPQALIQSIAWLAAHGRDEGWWGDITGGHRDAPGATTACPGKHLYAAVPAIRSLAKQGAEPEPKVKPMYSPPVILEPIVGSCPAPVGAWLVAASGAVYAFGGAPFYGGPNGEGYWGNRKAARIDPTGKGGYVITATSGEVYSYGPGV